MPRSLIGLGLALVIWTPAVAGELTFADLNAEEQETTLAFMEGNSMHTLFHEAGHMLVSEFGLPVLGREEDAVDNLATLMLLEARAEDFDQALIDTADSFWMTDEMVKEAAAESEEQGEDVSAYYDEHSLDLQRSYQVVCLMVGADAERFSEVADDYDLPKERRDACAFTYEQAAQSWQAVLEPHSGNAPGSISVVYDDPQDGNLSGVAEILKERQLLERVAEVMTGRYALTSGITFRATTCGTVNAFWDPSAREVTLCYELAGYYAHQMIEWIAWERENGDGESASE